MKKPMLVFTILLMAALFTSCSLATNNNVSKTKADIERNISNTNTTSIDTKKSVANTYAKLNKLPLKYPVELAQKNGDVVMVHGKGFNIEKLDKFIEGCKTDKSDMVRITTYTTEGDAIIYDIIKNGEGLRLTVDTTRDIYSSKDNRIIKEYKVTDIYQKKDNEMIVYTITLDDGNSVGLAYSVVN